MKTIKATATRDISFKHLSRSEREFSYTINEEDLKAGFFYFETTYKRHLDKLMTRVGKENILEIVPSRIGGKEVSWLVKLPKKVLRTTPLGLIRTQTSFDRTKREVGAERLKSMQDARKLGGG